MPCGSTRDTITESGDPTELDVGSIPDGTFGKRVGATFVGAKVVVPLQFVRQNVAASSSGLQFGVAGGIVATTEHVLPAAGKLVGISLFFTGSHSAGVLTARTRKNGSADGTLLLTTPTSGQTGYFTGTGVSFAAGDRVGAEVDTDGSWDGTSGTIVLTLWIQFNL